MKTNDFKGGETYFFYEERDLRRLAGRLGQEGFKSLDGIFQTFLNLYHLAVSDIVVDLHDDIEDMVRQLSAVNADYSEMKNEIGRQAAALNS